MEAGGRGGRLNEKGRHERIDRIASWKKKHIYIYIHIFNK